MALYQFFSCNVEVQYKGYFLSKAMLFTLLTTLLTILLPFILAHRARGFWMRHNNYYEHPSVHFTYDYLLYMETDNPREPIICTDGISLSHQARLGHENCAEIQVQEEKCDKRDNNCHLNVFANIIIPEERTVTSIMLILGLDFQLNGICPLHMQSFGVIDKDITSPSSGLKYWGDLYLYQRNALPCHKNIVDSRFNSSLFNTTGSEDGNVVDYILDNYYSRAVTTRIKKINSRKLAGSTGTFELDIKLNIHEVEVKYTPSLLQELMHAWPQYLAFIVVFNWVFNKIKRFVFNNRLLMAWEVVPWKRKQ